MFSWPRRHVVGLDISDRSIEALQLKRTLQRVRVAAVGRLELAAGIVEAGEIRQPAALAQRLREVLDHAQPQPIHERLCVLSLPESQVFSSVFTLPVTLDSRQARQVILSEAERYVPILLRESVYDFTVVGQRGDEQEVVYVAARKTLVRQYVEVCRAAGLLPIAFEPEAWSVSRSLLPRRFGERTPVTLVVDLGARSTNAHLIVQGVPAGSLTIPRAGDHLTAAVAASFELKAGAAEQQKRRAELGLTGGGRDGSTAAVLRRELQPVVAELQRFVGYAREHRRITVEQVVLSGGTALLPGLPDHLTTQLSLPVSVGDPFKRLVGTAERFNRDAVLYADVVGLALRGVERDPSHWGINLLAGPREREPEGHARFRNRPQHDRRLLVLVTAFGSSLAILLGLVVYRSRSMPSARPPVPPLVDWSQILAPRQHVLRFSLAGVTDNAAGATLNGRWLTAAARVTGTFDAHGTTTQSTAATVRIHLRNASSQSLQLVAGTRLQASDGTVLRLSSTVPLTAAGSATVQVEPPVEVAQLSPGRLIFPGLPLELRDKIFGELLEPYQAVSRTVTAVSAADVVSAEPELLQRGERIAREQLVSQLDGHEYLIPVLVPDAPKTLTAVPPVGTPAERWQATLEVRFGGLATERGKLDGAIQQAFGLKPQALQQVSFDHPELDLERNLFSVIIKTSQLPVEK